MCLDFGLKLSFKVMVRNIKLMILERSEISMFILKTHSTHFIYYYTVQSTFNLQVNEMNMLLVLI